jgi:Tol biopolymer transport system component
MATESTVQVVPPTESDLLFGVTFSPDGNYIYFSKEHTNGDADAYVVPVLGGPLKLLVKNVFGGVALAPDGKRMAFVRLGENYTLDVANTDGTGDRTIAERKEPEGFSMNTPPSWSPDGKLIAVPSRYTAEDNVSAIFCYRVDGGKPTIFPSRQSIERVAWLPDQTGLLFLMAPPGGLASNFTSNQFWEQPFPQGNPQRVTNDLNDYKGISLTGDGKLLASVERDLSSTVLVGPSSDPDHGASVTASKFDGLSLAWMPDGKLLLQDAKFQLSESGADGKNRVPFFQAPLQSFNFSVCGNGQFIVYGAVAQEKNSSQIWRVDATGRNQKRLTNESNIYAPHCSPDGASVAYSSILNGKDGLMTTRHKADQR